LSLLTRQSLGAPACHAVVAWQSTTQLTKAEAFQEKAAHPTHYSLSM
jgi:hypothetical protein